MVKGHLSGFSLHKFSLVLFHLKRSVQSSYLFLIYIYKSLYSVCKVSEHISQCGVRLIHGLFPDYIHACTVTCLPQINET